MFVNKSLQYVLAQILKMCRSKKYIYNQILFTATITQIQVKRLLFLLSKHNYRSQPAMKLQIPNIRQRRAVFRANKTSIRSPNEYLM